MEEEPKETKETGDTGETGADWGLKKKGVNNGFWR
jgi:hypothetical protein